MLNLLDMSNVQHHQLNESLVSDSCTDADLFSMQCIPTVSFQRLQIIALVFQTLHSLVHQYKSYIKSPLLSQRIPVFQMDSQSPSFAELFSRCFFPRLQLSVLPRNSALLFPISSVAQILPFILVCLATRPICFISILQDFSLLYHRGYFHRSYQLFCTVHLPWRKTLL